METAPKFPGPEYVPELDEARLTTQHERIKALMLDGVWRTLPEIAALTGDPPAFISAQLRHMKKAEFGLYRMNKRRRGEGQHGLYEYQVLEPGEQMPEMKSCVVVLDGHGDLHAAVMGRFQTALAAARELVKNTIPYDEGEWFQYGEVEGCDDPGKARLIGRGVTALGQFQMGKAS